VGGFRSVILALDLTDVTLIRQAWRGSLGLSQVSMISGRFLRLTIMIDMFIAGQASAEIKTVFLPGKA
jgi:hypothetical protein